MVAVRRVRPHWLAFLEPANSRNVGIPTSLTPFPFDDVVYAPHKDVNHSDYSAVAALTLVGPKSPRQIGRTNSPF